ncbi:MAG: outer membrane lipoprotein chaperone LolA [Acidobacteria bacterium]|nr:outer membrane lipoprotein chaperone LolA [Acidobacteriota bacterium]
MRPILLRLNSFYAPFHVRAFVVSFCLFLCGCLLAAESYGSDLDGVVDGLQRRYAKAETVTGTFQQTYRAPGVEQVESGIFRMKRPGLMRWEYRQPEEKLFIADGREAFLYVPLDRQVTVQSFRASDIHGTPLDLLLGGAEIRKSFDVSWEKQLKPTSEQTALIRLTPRSSAAEYESLILEIDPKSFDLRRIVIREHGGNTSEFLLSNIALNVRMKNRDFQFKPPKGVEVVRLNSEE